MRNSLLTIAIVLTFMLSGCASMSTPGPVRDQLLMPQDATAYLNPATANKRIVDSDRQKILTADFLERHFNPWHRKEAAHKEDDLFWGFRYASKQLYGENTLLRDSSFVPGLKELADRGSYPNLGRRAIATSNTSMRVLPTDKPGFYDFSRAGEGFPFDYLQNSGVWAGTPLYAVHSTRDGSYVLCESRFAAGWIRIEDLAFVDDEVASVFDRPDQVALISDNVAVRDKDGLYLFKARLGSLYPVVSESEEGWKVLVPARDEKARAMAVEAILPRSAAARMPLAFTPFNVALLANRTMGRPYGWGGMFGERDCSASLMDLMTPFGIFLPRNSKSQANAGRRISLEDLSAPQKESTILSRGEPFATLIYKPGHIMLYIGRFEGKPVIYHTMWGLRTEDEGVKPGRKIVGATVITSLEPGKELSTLVTPRGLLVETISAMVLLPKNP